MALKKDNSDKVKALLDRAADGIREFLDGDKYKEYLHTMGKFHEYSARNSLLILMQRPDATLVAGYSTWQSLFQRQVQRGEKGIQIVAYSTRKSVERVDRRDRNGNLVYDEKGNVVTDTAIKKVPQFIPVYVWDVKQTAGKPLPEIATELEGSVKNYSLLQQAIQDISDFPITFANIPNGAKGYCDHAKKTIVIQSGMSEAQTVKTALHELAHSIMHEGKKNLDRRTKEVQAESVAFAVCDHYGIDTSDYTFPYLATWSSSTELKELQASMDTIQKAINSLIHTIDSRFAELQKEQALKQPEQKHQSSSTVLDPTSDDSATYTIYQLKRERSENLFVNYANTPEIRFEDYAPCWTDTYPADWSLEDIYRKFNTDRPENFTGHSLSVSDIVVIQRGNQLTAHFVDSVGYRDVPDFARALQQARKLESMLNEEAILDTVRYDGELDLDKEPSRPSIRDRIESAKAEAERRNTEREALAQKSQQRSEEK